DQNWYELQKPEETDSPALLIYKERAIGNIEKAIKEVGGPQFLRPHVKTNKSIEACRLMMDAGIEKFKCATIAEAEMLVMAGARDILFAYQPVGPKVHRFLRLVTDHNAIQFHCLVDHIDAAKKLDEEAGHLGLTVSLYIDLNAGTNRTGVFPGPPAEKLYDQLSGLENLKITGFHLYDGHLRNPVFEIRKEECDKAFLPIAAMRDKIEKENGVELEMIAGGSTTFPIHAQRERVICGPGTFIYWDNGYGKGLPEQDFSHAALVMTRVIALPSEDLVCLDLGHKSISSENPLENRVSFLNAPELIPVSQSEEHLVMKTHMGHEFKIGDVLYGIPYHICPTVALFDRAAVVELAQVREEWKIIARDRKITI
ncbi:MAG: D-TA family PLP-dependent enzyme, partial [Cyclobacteriaceae bacterium]